jgi:hypothetical protein
VLTERARALLAHYDDRAVHYDLAARQ